jgi:hypothetical protein
VGKFDESAANGAPLVVIFDNEISGRDPAYLNAYLKFIDYAVSKKATFVTTSELVDISKGAKQASVSTNTMTSAAKSGCLDCDALKNATINTTTQNEANQNKTASAEMTVSIKPNFEG